MLSTGPLLYLRYTFLEVPETSIAGLALKTLIDLGIACNRHTPLNKVILEYALVELMEEIRGESGEDVCMGKVSPKGLEDWAKAVLLER